MNSTLIILSEKHFHVTKYSLHICEVGYFLKISDTSKQVQQYIKISNPIYLDTLLSMKMSYETQNLCVLLNSLLVFDIFDN